MRRRRWRQYRILPPIYISGTNPLNNPSADLSLSRRWRSRDGRRSAELARPAGARYGVESRQPAVTEQGRQRSAELARRRLEVRGGADGGGARAASGGARAHLGRAKSSFANVESISPVTSSLSQLVRRPWNGNRSSPSGTPFSPAAGAAPTAGSARGEVCRGGRRLLSPASRSGRAEGSFAPSRRRGLGEQAGRPSLPLSGKQGRAGGRELHPEQAARPG
ncbi:unnamed protein product [Urochloa humidicola]